jgi:hypothetical protein
MIFPISFSIPESKIISKIQTKTKLFGHVVPWHRETYVFNTEKEYYNDYATSVFGLTELKGGWDCMRHYEILANGCIPWFKDLDKCPPNTMTNFPKELVLKAMKEIGHTRDFNSELVKSYSEALLGYTRMNLTTVSIAKYILKTIGREDVKSVLFINPCHNLPEYLSSMVLHGFKSLLKSECHDSPYLAYHYTDFPERVALNHYGKGFSYTRITDKTTCRNFNYDNTLTEDIKNHKYDIVIYGSPTYGKPNWDLINKYYRPNEIILLCGRDLHVCELPKEYPDYHCFIREL